MRLRNWISGWMRISVKARKHKRIDNNDCDVKCKTSLKILIKGLKYDILKVLTKKLPTMKYSAIFLL